MGWLCSHPLLLVCRLLHVQVQVPCVCTLIVDPSPALMIMLFHYLADAMPWMLMLNATVEPRCEQPTTVSTSGACISADDRPPQNRDSAWHSAASERQPMSKCWVVLVVVEVHPASDVVLGKSWVEPTRALY